MKVFSFDRSSETQINDFISGVSVIKDGFMLQDGMMGILYKEKNEYGIGKDQMIMSISAELAKSQNQYVLQEGLVRAYGDMVELFTGKRAAKQATLDGLNTELTNYDGSWDKDLEFQFNTLSSNVAVLEKKHKNASKTGKEAVLKEIYTANESLKPVKEAFETYKTAFENGKAKMKNEINALTIEIVNLSGKIKENRGFLEQSTEDREHAKVFIASCNKLIADIDSGKIEEEIAA